MTIEQRDRDDRDPLYQAARSAICFDSGLLRSVQYGSYEETPRLVSAVLLTFEFRTWLLTVEPDDDTIRIADHVDRDLVFSAPPQGSPWEAAYGASVMWAWAMENQQGYADGIQLSFAREGKEERLIQLIAMASAWRIVSWDLLPH